MAEGKSPDERSSRGSKNNPRLSGLKPSKELNPPVGPQGRKSSFSATTRPSKEIAGRMSIRPGGPNASDGISGRRSSFNGLPVPVERIPLQKRVAKFMELPAVEIAVVGLVACYSIVVFTQIIVDDKSFNDNETMQELREILRWIDFVILLLFGLEVSLKVYAFRMGYFREWLYLFDAIIVVGCLLMSITEMIIGGEELRRFGRMRAVMRLLRIIVMFRKVQSAQKAVRTVVGESGVNLHSPVERVLAVLNENKLNRELPRTLREGIQDSIRIIALNQLYEPVFETGEGGANALSEAAQEWVTNASAEKARGTVTGKKPRGTVAGGELGFARQSTFTNKQRRTKQMCDGGGAILRDSSTSEANTSVMDGSESPLAITTDVVEQDTSPYDILLTDEVKGMLRAGLEEGGVFDIFEFNNALKGQALRVISIFAMIEYHLFEEFPLNLPHFDRYITVVQSSYACPAHLRDQRLPLDGDPRGNLSSGSFLTHPYGKSSQPINPYHSALHGADVAQTMLAMLIGAEFCEVADIQAPEFFALVLAAAIHDFRHPGFTNVFCVKSRHPLAIRYNDNAVLEMFHAATGFELMLHKNCTALEDCDTATYELVRELAVTAILATDMQHHFADLGQFKSQVQAGTLLKRDENDSVPKKDKILCGGVLLHACDISNPGKSRSLYLAWTARVLTEFFNQGDEEKKRGLPVSMFMDRVTTNIAKCQIGFLDFIVAPLFTALFDLVPGVEPFLDNIKSNRAFWDDKVERMEKEMEGGTQRLPGAHGGVIELSASALPDVVVELAECRQSFSSEDPQSSGVQSSEEKNRDNSSVSEGDPKPNAIPEGAPPDGEPPDPDGGAPTE